MHRHVYLPVRNLWGVLTGYRCACRRYKSACENKHG